MKRVLILLSLFCMLPSNSFAQFSVMHEWNFGYTHRQEVLPKSKAPVQSGVRVAKVDEPVVFVPTANNEVILSSGWEMIEMHKVVASDAKIFDPYMDSKSWYNATVSGTVMIHINCKGITNDFLLII